MKSINNTNYDKYDLTDLRSEGQLIREEELHDELECRLSDLEWIFSEFETVNSSFVDEYEALLNELGHDTSRFDRYFGPFGLRWEYEMDWDA